MAAQGRPGEADVVRFTALALASPQSWRTVRLVRSFRPADEHRPAVRAWVRRPRALRVEDLGGRLLEAKLHEPGPRTSTRFLTLGGDGGEVPPEADDSWLPISMRRPEAPFWSDYHWVAMLDPYELAVGSDLETGAETPALVVDEVGEVDHHGRPALQAMVRTLPGYDPRCDCCPLLPGVHSEARSVEAGGGRLSDQHPGWEHADCHVVRLDLGTGICVLTEQVGGSWHGRGHDVVVEAVDEDMPDELFVPPEPRRRMLGRRGSGG